MLSSPSPFWFIASEEPCTVCRGTGLDWHANAGSPGDCPVCRGSGARARRASRGGSIHEPRALLTVAAVALLVLMAAVVAVAPMAETAPAEITAVIRRLV